MNSARITTPENRLAKILTYRDGPTMEELVADADRRVTTLAGQIRQFVDGQLTLILPFADYEDDQLFAECRALAALTIQVAEVAGAAGLTAVGEVAAAISAMVDGLLTRGVWHGDALRLHIRALILIGRAPERSGEPTVMLEMLRRMRAVVGPELWAVDETARDLG